MEKLYIQFLLCIYMMFCDMWKTENNLRKNLFEKADIYREDLHQQLGSETLLKDRPRMYTC
jgi:hypothetical protein